MKSNYAAITDESKLDPRVVRTRRLLLDSFQELLKEHTAIRDISIQSITIRAGVNRVTFYAHFTDKYELLDFWKRELFRQKLTEKLGNNTDLTLNQLVDAMLDFMADYHRLHRRINQQFDTLFEAAIQDEIQMTLQHLFDIPADTVIFLSWAMFGSANEWGRDQNKLPKAAMAKRLMQLVDRVIS